VATHCKRGHDLTLVGARRVQDNRCESCYRERFPTTRGSEAWLAKVEAGRVGTAYGGPLGNKNAERAICAAGLHEMNDDNRMVVKTARGKLSTVCHACNKAYQRQYKNARVQHYSAKYVARCRFKSCGVTAVEYAEMLVQHKGVCAICKGVNKDGRSLALDHDHQTGKKRGLLCGRCNLTLGRVEDDTEILWNMIQYLENRGSVH
jgi:Recombination endonuclease VII